MGLKQIKDADRIVFLKMFVEEILINFADKYKSRKAIEEEKIRMKILEPIPDNFREYEIPQKDIGRGAFVKPEEKIDEEQLKRKVTIHLTKSPNRILPSTFNKPKSSPNLFGMQKINKLLRDQAVQMIECPGPGKYLVIKKRNKVNVTQLVMSQDEIFKVINNFSEQAKIPVIEGILRAAVGDLMISAVSSQFIGSRFIITRNTPYSLISGEKLSGV